MRRFSLTLLLTVLPLILEAAPRAVERAMPSVALLLLEDDKGQPKALGSGFFIKRNIVATSLDLVAEANGGYAKVSGQNAKYEIKGVVATDAVNNLALIEVEGANVQPLELGDDSKVKVGDRIYALGNPKGLEAVIADGIVSGVHQKGNDRFFQVTATINPGSNGGPVLDEQGNVIGVGQSFFSDGKLLSITVPSSFAADLGRDVRAASFNAKAAVRRVNSKPLNEAVKFETFVWDTRFATTTSDTGATISLVNTLDRPIKDVVSRITFKDENQRPVHSFIISSKHLKTPSSWLKSSLKPRADDFVDAVIPAANAVRIPLAVPLSVKKLTAPYTQGGFFKGARFTVQIISFNVVETKASGGRFDPANLFGN